MKKYLILIILSSLISSIFITVDRLHKVESQNFAEKLFYNKVKYNSKLDTYNTPIFVQDFNFRLSSESSNGEGICKLCAWAFYCTDECGNQLP